MAMTLDQQRAVALATAAKAKAMAGQQTGDAPPAGAVPGSREYADWAASAARAGKELPQVSQPVNNPSDTYLSQGLSGFNEGLAKGMGAPVDIMTGGINAGIGLLNNAAHTDVPRIDHPVGGSEMFTDLMAPTIAPPSNDPGKQVVRRITEEVGAGAIPMGGIAAHAASPLRSLAGQVAATLGSGAGAATAEQVAPGNPYAELAGEILGGLGVGGAAGLVRRAVTPNPMSAERAAAVQTLRNEGVDLTAGQATGAKGLKYAESELGGGRVADIMERQSRQFTRAALARAGVNADAASPQVIDGAFRDLGREFDGLAARNTLAPDPQMGRDLSAMVADYHSMVPASQRAPIINDVLGDLVTNFRNGGALSGQAYQSIRSRLDRAARASRLSDPQLSQALFGFRNALDGAMERGIAARNPTDLAAWQDARHRYSNLLVIEKAAAGGGEKAGLGIISPAQLKQAAANQNHRAFTRGQSDFTDLAKAGQATMSPMPESGTSYRLAARGLVNLPSIIGAVAGGSGGDIAGATIGALAGHAVPATAGRLLLSDLGRRYLGNQVLTQPILDGTSQLGPLAAIVANQSGGQQSRISGGR